MIDDEIRINTLKETIGYEMSELGVDFLEPGDLLCSTDHVEFYVGYIKAHKWISRDIEELIDVRKLNEDYIEYSNYYNKNNKLKNPHVRYSTFGWGNVQNEFPKQNYYFTYKNNNFVWNRGPNDPAGGYKTIWRKN